MDGIKHPRHWSRRSQLVGAGLLVLPVCFSILLQATWRWRHIKRSWADWADRQVERLFG